jgi:hypothetical protein
VAASGTIVAPEIDDAFARFAARDTPERIREFGIVSGNGVVDPEGCLDREAKCKLLHRPDYTKRTFDAPAPSGRIRDLPTLRSRP